MRVFSLLVAQLVLAAFLITTAHADTTYVIRKGDCPSSIARKFGVSAKDIMKANKLRAGRLMPGTKIAIPSKKETKSAKAMNREAGEAKKKLVERGKDETRQSVKTTTESKAQGEIVYYAVRKRDTLGSISREYGTTVAALKEMNNLKSSKLKIGQKLIVEGKTSGEQIAKKGEIPKLGAKTQQEVRTPGEPVYHSVRKGDTLAAISTRYSTNVAALKEMNNLKSSKLKIGQKLIVERKTSGEQIAKKGEIPKLSAKTQQEVRTPGETLYHSVGKGDTLAVISKKYRTSVAALKEMNNLKSAKLKIGQKLVVGRTKSGEYVVKKGDTLWSIAKRFGLHGDELMDMNLMETPELSLGQTLMVKLEEPREEQKKIYEAILSAFHNDLQTREREIKAAGSQEDTIKLGLHDRLILFAKKMLDIPYRFGGNTLLGIDCSAYVKKVYSLVGVELPRSAREQFNEGTSVDEEELSMGDLVFFKTYASFPSHVGIYLGNNLFIHASSRSKKVTIDNLTTPYYLKRFIGAKRLLDGKQAKQLPEKEG